jgi:hypothetical protein
MLNVVNLRERAQRAPRAPEPQLSTGVDLNLSELASRITRLQLKAREDILNAILMLDLAAQHARQIASRMSDPEARKNFEEYLSTIEQLLEIARSMALRL